MLNMLGLDVNKWVIYVICIVLGTGIVGGGYYIWKHGIESTAQLKFNNQQLQQTLQDDEKFIKEKDAINAQQDKAISDLSSEKDKLDAKLKGLNDFLNSGDTAKGDRPSSEILKTTVRKLKNLK